MVKNLIKKSLIPLKNLRYDIFKPKARRFLHEKMPYYSQWESREMVDGLIAGKQKAEDDPKWRLSGAKNKLEYINWSWNTCGITCLQMILSYLKNTKIPLVGLAKRSMAYGVFKLDKGAFAKGDYLKSLDGLFYQPFLEFIDQEFDLKGRIISPMVLGEIIKELSLHNFVMASVGGSIRDLATKNAFKGGHLVLVVGYDLDKAVLYLHNPSGLFQKSQEYAEVSFQDFARFFDNKGIVINRP